MDSRSRRVRDLPSRNTLCPLLVRQSGSAGPRRSKRSRTVSTIDVSVASHLKRAPDNERRSSALRNGPGMETRNLVVGAFPV